MQTDTQTHRHINTMTRPGLGAGPSEKGLFLQERLFVQNIKEKFSAAYSHIDAFLCKSTFHI